MLQWTLEEESLYFRRNNSDVNKIVMDSFIVIALLLLLPPNRATIFSIFVTGRAQPGLAIGSLAASGGEPCMSPTSDEDREDQYQGRGKS